MKKEFRQIPNIEKRVCEMYINIQRHYNAKKAVEVEENIRFRTKTLPKFNFIR